MFEFMLAWYKISHLYLVLFRLQAAEAKLNEINDSKMFVCSYFEKFSIIFGKVHTEVNGNR